MLRGFLLVLLALYVSGCATLGADQKKEELTIAATSEDEFKPVAFEAASGVADYTFKDAPHKVEWLSCKTKNSRGAILVMHRDRAGFEDKKFCEGWIAQTFLGQGFDAITINRPGYGDSTGVVDFAGEQSMVALEAGLKDALAKGKHQKGAVGLWGYSTGVTAAALFARKHPGFQFMLLGGGIYDYEQTEKLTTDSYIKKDIETISKTGGAKAIEDRSIGYDVSGLPKIIAVYHGKQDSSAPLAQAKAFGDSLQSAEYKVTYQEIDGVAHEIPWTHHRKILEVLVHSVVSGG